MPAAALRPAPLVLSPDAAGVRARFGAAVERFDRSRPVLVLCDKDADGLSAGALFVRAFRAAGWTAEARVVGRGESPWSEAMRDELSDRELGGLVITDLGVRDGGPRPDTPTVVVDHHVPTGEPDAEVITGYGLDPVPTSSLLAFWCAGALADVEPWLWLAALGIIGDLAEDAGFSEMAAARVHGITALRDAVSLINAPRRSASGDAAPALELLLDAHGPREITNGSGPQTAALRAAKAEVKAELDAARRMAPKVRGGVALIRFASPTQIHPLIAQQWRGRLKGDIVMAANTGFRPGWVHFAVRTARDLDLVDWLAQLRPDGADENYGSGHHAATGGALRTPAWNAFVDRLGFPEERIAA